MITCYTTVDHQYNFPVALLLYTEIIKRMVRIMKGWGRGRRRTTKHLLNSYYMSGTLVMVLKGDKWDTQVVKQGESSKRAIYRSMHRVTMPNKGCWGHEHL